MPRERPAGPDHASPPSGDRSRRATDLLVRVGEGDLGALAELYDELGAVVFAMASRGFRDPGPPADVTHDVFLRVWREARTFDPGRGSAWAWIYAVATAGETGQPPLTEAAGQGLPCRDGEVPGQRHRGGAGPSADRGPTVRPGQ